MSGNLYAAPPGPGVVAYAGPTEPTWPKPEPAVPYQPHDPAGLKKALEAYADQLKPEPFEPSRVSVLVAIQVLLEASAIRLKSPTEKAILDEAITELRRWLDERKNR